jgi:hypothetical protein
MSGLNFQVFPVVACWEELRDGPSGLFRSSAENTNWVRLVYIAGWHCGVVTLLPAGPAAMVVAWGGFLHRPGLFSTPTPPKKTAKTPTARPQELLIPSSDPKTITGQIRAQVGMATNAALRKANAPTNIGVMSVRQNMTSNLLLTPAPNTSTQELPQYANTISAAISSVNPSLQPPRPVKKWHTLAVHGVPTELYPDTEEGMRALQADIKQQNYAIQLAQLPRYMSHPDKRAGKAASSIIIAVRTRAEASVRPHLER